MARKAVTKPDVDPEPDDAAPMDLTQVPLTPLEVATFIESMAAELQVMANSSHFDTLSYFLDMTRIEASAQIEQLARRRPN